MQTAPLTVLVTGASSGIGRATACLLATHGHTVFASARRQDRLDTLVHEAAGLPGRILPVPMDVTSDASVRAATEGIRVLIGGAPDAVVCCAGYGQYGPLETVSSEQLTAQLETNVVGTMRVSRAFLPEMRRRGHGRLVHMGSIAGRHALPLMGAYGASKHALAALTDALRIEVGHLGVQVVLIEPGPIRTPFSAVAIDGVSSASVAGTPWAPAMRDAQAVRARFEALGGEPEAVARAVLKALTARRPRARYVVPRRFMIQTWLLRLLPTPLGDRLLRWALGLGGPPASPAAGPQAHGAPEKPHEGSAQRLALQVARG